ncbi:hypothetical protein BaRGS_00028476 [Batillaria attramentaria]|uniref:Uncharacterized protein n=1 Tax=Batillaria attramentaria TaxID=370345 RepID=A0ABD0JZS3_9CAEN
MTVGVAARLPPPPPKSPSCSKDVKATINQPATLDQKVNASPAERVSAGNYSRANHAERKADWRDLSGIEAFSLSREQHLVFLTNSLKKLVLPLMHKRSPPGLIFRSLMDRLLS